MGMFSCLTDTTEAVNFSETICSCLTVLSDGFCKHYGETESDSEAGRNWIRERIQRKHVTQFNSDNRRTSQSCGWSCNTV